MVEARADEQHRLAKLALVIALALAGQLVARWIGGRYVTNLGAPAQSASVAIDLILLACAPLGFFAAPKLSIRVLPLLHDRDFNRAFFRSLVFALISLAASMAMAMIPHLHAPTAGTNGPIPTALAMLLAIAAAFREEIEFRLGLLTVLAWIIHTLTRGQTGSASLWIGNLAQAMAFGAFHQIAGFTGRTSALSLRGVMLEPRTVSGVILGYAYIRYGIETAIIAHALRDGAILGLATLLART